MFRILSLDGGGAWALIQVQALIDRYGENTPGHKVLQDFDLAAANSGGSLVLGGLLKDLRLSELRTLFMNEAQRKAIFSPTRSPVWRSLGWLQRRVVSRALREWSPLGPRYSAPRKLVALQGVLGACGNRRVAGIGRGLGRSTERDLHVLIIAFDYDHNRATFFRSASSGAPGIGDSEEAGVTLAEAIHASTNAPVNYFDAPALAQGDRYWDGGITGCNNPVLAAVTEAIGMGVPPGEIAALSIGTGTVALPWAEHGNPAGAFAQSRPGIGFLTAVGKVAHAILGDPPDMATFVAHMMTGRDQGLPDGLPSRIVRVNPLISPVPPNWPKADDRDRLAEQWNTPGGMGEAALKYLIQLDMDAVEQDQVQRIAAFTTLWLEDRAMNQPVRMDPLLKPEIGRDRYSAAMRDWERLLQQDGPPQA